MWGATSQPTAPLQTLYHPAAEAARRGPSLVEVALVLPVVVTVLLGVAEANRAITVGSMVSEAAREGARLATVQGMTNVDIQQKVASLLEPARIPSSEVSVDISVSNEAAAGRIENALPQDMVTVKVTVPFDQVGYIGSLFLEGRKLSGQSSVQRP